MANRSSLLSNRLIKKLGITFLLFIILMGSVYVMLSVYLSQEFYDETAQRLNANIANHLIEEKFQEAAPILEDGSINKPLFGDLMHDMMAVNRGIEVYLLDEDGLVRYSVVLDHSNPNEPAEQVDLSPVNDFIAKNGETYILGDDPRNPGEKKIFSAAAFEKNNFKGYIYIVLAGENYQAVNKSLFSGYATKLGLTATVLTMIFASLIALFSIWFLTRNLRTIVHQVNRFREGDIKSRIPNPEKSDLSTLAHTFNDMADTISENIEEIKSVDVLRRELIANVSHDLRTPLAIMQGYIETLQMKKDDLSPTDSDKYMEIIEKNTRQLNKMVNQLFELSKLEAKQVTPEKEAFPITDLIYDLSAKYQILAEEKQIKLEVNSDGITPLVYADIGLVERAVQNLLDNALKFSPEKGNISINISHDNKNVRVMIQDDGPGISKEEQVEIFERYAQSKNGNQRVGAGLGLAIVKKIMELHETRIVVDSVPNIGSSFSFDLPAYAS